MRVVEEGGQIPRPHAWMMHEPLVPGGIVKIFFREDLVFDETGKAAFVAEFSKEVSVREVRLYRDYIAVWWRPTKGLSDEAYEAVPGTLLVIGIEVLSRYFNWRGELLIHSIEDGDALKALRLREGCPDRWWMGRDSHRL